MVLDIGPLVRCVNTCTRARSLYLALVTGSVHTEGCSSVAQVQDERVMVRWHGLDLNQ